MIEVVSKIDSGGWNFLPCQFDGNDRPQKIDKVFVFGLWILDRTSDES
jgi:hypothetical protein